jgi:hypothetical protein
MVILVDMARLRRIPLDGEFRLQYQPYFPVAALLYRDDCAQGILVNPDGSDSFSIPVVGDHIRNAGGVAIDREGIRIVYDEQSMSFLRIAREMNPDLDRKMTDEGW